MANFVEGIIDNAETIVEWFSSMLRQNLEDYCHLETADSDSVLVTHDGSLLSIIRVSGANYLVGEQEFNSLHSSISSSLRAYMSSGGHALQVYFERDREGVADEIRRILRKSSDTATELGMDISDVIDDQVKALSKHCSVESCFYVLYTRPSALTKSEQRRATELKKESYKGMPPAQFSQDPIKAVAGIRDRHQSFVSAFVSDLASTRLTATLLNSHRAVREIRMTADRDFTDVSWRPYLPGDKIPARMLNRISRDISDIQWPRLSSQIFPRDGMIEDLNYYRVGGRLFSPLFIDLGPKDPLPFQVLFRRVAETGVPWRISFLIESGGLQSIKLKSLLAAILSFTNSGNELLADAESELREQVKLMGDADVKIRISLATWVNDGDINKLRSRSSQLARAVEGWGGCEINEASGDPAAGVISSGLGMTLKSIATPSAAPLSDIVSMLPIARPASPWDDGAILFRTADGKIWPYQPGSSKQTHWVDLIFAQPGSGKSVLLNKINYACCLSPGLKRLPRILIIDIGPSSSGLISMLKDYLPDDQKHLASYHRLQMTRDYAINPFDTLLGCRSPMTQHRAFLVNFLILLATPIGGEIYDGMADMIGLVIDEVYKISSDKVRAKIYTQSIDEDVDAAIEASRIAIDRKTTWWEVVDALTDKGDFVNATRAQRYAVPILADVIEASRTESIRSIYSFTAPTNETMIEAFSRMISGAIREYPILSLPTRFDISNSRVVSIDLDDVAKSGGGAADRQTAIMYMLTRSLARDFHLKEDVLPQIPERYRKYHRVRIKEMQEDVKRICFDEFHRTEAAPAVREQVVVDIREGRKHGVHISLLSQNVEDFAEFMIENATGIFILNGGQQLSVDKMTKLFGLSNTARYALTHHVHGPKAGVGATFLAKFSTTSGENIQLITSTIGSIEYWAFSTTVEDVIVRNFMYNKIGAKRARAILAKVYPYGVKDEVQHRRNRLKEELGNDILDEKDELGVVDQISKEVLDLHYEMLNKEQT